MRAQASVEFVLITVVMLLFFAVAFISAQNTYTNIQDNRLETQAFEFFSSLEAEFSVAQEAGVGYQRDITLPKTFSGVPFDIELRENQTSSGSDEIFLTVNEEDYFYFLITPISGTLDHGDYTIYGGDEVYILPRENPSASASSGTLDLNAFYNQNTCEFNTSAQTTSGLLWYEIEHQNGTQLYGNGSLASFTYFSYIYDTAALPTGTHELRFHAQDFVEINLDLRLNVTVHGGC